MSRKASAQKAARRFRLWWWLTIPALVAGVGVAAFKLGSRPGSHLTSAGQQSGETVEALAFGPTITNKTRAPNPAPEGMVWIPGGEFSMGSPSASESLCGLP